MKITIVAVGRLKKGPWHELIQEYSKRLNWSVSVKEVEAKPGLTGAALKAEEGRLILKAIPEGACVLALDERGEGLSSEAFAQKLNHIQHHQPEGACFIIGGADGLSDAVRSQAHQLISFGQTTWPHMMVRVMLFEQIYRAQQILKGHPYHRG